MTLDERIKKTYTGKIIRVRAVSGQSSVVAVQEFGDGWIEVVHATGEAETMATGNIESIRDVTDSKSHPHPMRDAKKT